jgi:membrane associated rhomboid family serine protease
MISLYFIGTFLESLIGKRRLFGFYFSAGIFAGLFYGLLAFLFGNAELGARIFGSADGFALGASGAIFGIAGVLAVLTPKNRVYLLAGPLIAIILEYLSIGLFKLDSLIVKIFDLFVFFYIILAIFSVFNSSFRKISLPLAMPFWVLPIAAIIPLVLLAVFIELPIGNMAHLGGFLAGAIYGFYLRLRYKKKTEMIARYFSR